MNTFDVNHFKEENNKYLFERSFDFSLTISHDVLICFLGVDKPMVFDPSARWLMKVLEISNKTLEHQLSGEIN